MRVVLLYAPLTREPVAVFFHINTYTHPYIVKGFLKCVINGSLNITIVKA